MIADQCLQRIAPAGDRGLRAAQLIGLRAPLVLGRALVQQTLAQRDDFFFEPLDRGAGGLKALPRFGVLHAQRFFFVARLACLGV